MSNEHELLDEALAISYKNNKRYDAFTALIGKKFGLGEFSEMSVKGTDEEDVWALRFGPGRGEFSGKITYLIANFSEGNREKSGYIRHYAISTLKEPVEFINGEYRLRSGFVFLEIPDEVKNFTQLFPLLQELNTQGYVGTSVNLRRSGLDTTKNQIDIAVNNPERTKAFYKFAQEGRGFTKVRDGKEIRFEPNSIEAETFWTFRVFNDVDAAINATLAVIKKEVTQKVGSWDELTDAYADVDAQGNETSAESRINYDAPYILQISRDPGQIVMFDDYVKKLLQKFEDIFKQRTYKPQERMKYASMMVTQLLMLRGIESYLSFKLPYADEVLKMVAKMKADGKDPAVMNQFCKYFDNMYGAGDQRRAWELTSEILKEVVKDLEGPGFDVKYVQDGDETTIHFIWESKVKIPDAVMKKLANVLVKGRGSLKVKDLKYLLPAAIFTAKRKKHVEYTDLKALFKLAKKPEGIGEIAYFTLELLKKPTARVNQKLIQSLLLKFVAHEDILVEGVKDLVGSINS